MQYLRPLGAVRVLRSKDTDPLRLYKPLWTGKPDASKHIPGIQQIKIFYAFRPEWCPSDELLKDPQVEADDSVRETKIREAYEQSGE